MKNKSTTRVHKYSKSAGKETRKKPTTKDYVSYNTDSEGNGSSGGSENEIFHSTERDSDLFDSSPRKRKVRVRTQSRTSTNDIPRLYNSKKASGSLVNEVPLSIKKEPTFESSTEVKGSSSKTGRSTSARELSYSVATSSKDIELLPHMEKEVKKPSIKTGRRTSATEISSNFKTSQNKQNEFLPSKNEKDSSTTETALKYRLRPQVKKASTTDETNLQTFSSPKAPKENLQSSQRTSPSTPYALNRPQRSRIPPLAYWRGEHRSFRTLLNGDIVLIDLHIPDYVEKPKRKRRRISEDYQSIESNSVPCHNDPSGGAHFHRIKIEINSDEI